MIKHLQLSICIACCAALLAAPVLGQNKKKRKPKKPPPKIDHSSGKVPVNHFSVMGDLEITEWAHSPLFFNPTNMDIDHKGRIWVAEGRRYRIFKKRDDSWKMPKADRIMVVKDTNGDGKADSSHVFVEEEFLIAPLGVAVVGNKVIVSQPPALVVYTDVNENAVFDKGVDKREEILTGWSGRDHDHSLHSLTVGPNGQWYFNTGNAGNPIVKTPDGFRLYAGSFYWKTVDGKPGKENSGRLSSDGFNYIGGLALRMNPDATGMRVIGHNFRNSYEQVVTSFGEVFQNDNDDPPASRTSYLMEYANMGYARKKGISSWRAFRRFNFDMSGTQSVPEAEWGVDDPGHSPPGDVYGGGSPTGIAYYENGVMEKDWKGALFSCEPARNLVFAYKPKRQGAGYELKHMSFLTSKPAKFTGVDFKGGANSMVQDLRNLFRPSDICIGPDGAIYVADWFDSRVGGHQSFDNLFGGTIYRIAPKGFKPEIPDYCFDCVDGLVEVLKSPSPNVRAIGFYGLKEKGDEAVDAVAELIKDKNEYIRARAIYLLPQLGNRGIKLVEPLLKDNDEMTRVAAFRSLRFVNHELLAMSAEAAQDSSAAVRREAALAMRYVPAAQSKDILVTVINHWDGKDRNYLEAFGYGSDNKRTAIYQAVKDDCGDWDHRKTMIAWRLHPTSAIGDLKARALDSKVDQLERFRALDGIAFNGSLAAYQAMKELKTKSQGKMKERAAYWLKMNAKFDWQKYGEQAKLVYQDFKVPAMPAGKKVSVADVMALKGNIENGKSKISTCYMCHQIGDMGVEFGPGLTGWGKGQPREIIAKAIVEPSVDIAHGYKATQIVTKDSKTIQGFIVSDGDYVTVKVMGGIDVDIDAKDIAERSDFKQSVMIAGQDLGLSNQDIRDIVEYLKHN